MNKIHIVGIDEQPLTGTMAFVFGSEKHTGRALRGEASFLDVSRIDHVSDIVDGDGGFSLSHTGFGHWEFNIQ